jgi:hypothetical protein
MRKEEKMNKIKEELNYYFDVTLKFSEVIPAISKTEAVERLRDLFMDEYGIELEDKEIKYTGKEGRK